ncbi:MAG: histidine triad (HIT) family protein [Candidatus Nanohaloarchaea archaeon]|jgi:histidine triad (HIT) family protein
MTDDCIFCQIIDGELPGHKVYEDDKVVAFLDAHPVSKGHTLVVPKEHVDDIHEAENMSYMWKPLVKVSNAVKEKFGAEGVNIAQNNGEKAGQEVFHLHFHVTPIYDGNELDITYNRSELEEGEAIAEELREGLE